MGTVFRISHRSLYHQQAFVHRFEVYYWREGNDEVDFVLKKNLKIVAIEVKSNGETKTTSMERFHKLFNPLATIVVGENGIQPELFNSLY